MKINLIHFVSEQPLPNLLGWAAMRPARVVQFHSQERLGDGGRAVTNWARRAKDLARAATEAGLSADVEEHVLGGTEPSVAEVERAVEAALRSRPGPWVVNLTGGSKLFTIGALRAVQRNQAAAIYVDTRTKPWITSVGDAPVGLPEDQQFSERLSMREIATAYGHQLVFDEPTTPLLEFARETLRLRKDASLLMDDWLARARKEFFVANQEGRGDQRFPKKGDGLRDYLLRDLWFDDPQLVTWAEAAVRANLMWKSGTGQYHFCPKCERPTEATKSKGTEAEYTWRMLEGAWWELVVYQHFIQQGVAARDLCWSAREVGLESESGEIDLIVLDRRSFQVKLVACKTSDTYVKIATIRELPEMAKAWGGSFAGKELWIYNFLKNEGLRRKQAELVGVRMMTRDDLHASLR